MMKKLFTLVVLSALIFSLATPVLAGGAQGKEKAKGPTPDRWEGIVTAKNEAKSALTVRQSQGTGGRAGAEKTVTYDATTKWVSQEHASKTVNNIDAGQVKEGDRVICVGTVDDKGVFRASMVSKRLTNPTR